MKHYDTHLFKAISTNNHITFNFDEPTETKIGIKILQFITTKLWGNLDYDLASNGYNYLRFSGSALPVVNVTQNQIKVGDIQDPNDIGNIIRDGGVYNLSGTYSYDNIAHKIKVYGGSPAWTSGMTSHETNMWKLLGLNQKIEDFYTPQGTYKLHPNPINLLSGVTHINICSNIVSENLIYDTANNKINQKSNILVSVPIYQKNYGDEIYYFNEENDFDLITTSDKLSNFELYFLDQNYQPITFKSDYLCELKLTHI